MKRTRWLIKRCRRNLTFVEGRIFISDFLNASWMHMRWHAYLCRFSRLKPRNRLRKCVSAKSWCRSLESYWFTSVIYVVNRYFFFSFFSFFKETWLLQYFSRELLLFAYTIYLRKEKKEKRKSLSTDDTFLSFYKNNVQNDALIFKKIRYIYPVDSS